MGLFDWFKRNNKPGPGNWQVGDAVLAPRSGESYYYPGRIHALDKNRCQIAFDDGQSDWVLITEMMPLQLKKGTRVSGRLQAGGTYYPGVIDRLEGDKLHIRYDQGEEEWTTVSLIRLERQAAKETTVAEQKPEPPPPPPRKSKSSTGQQAA